MPETSEKTPKFSPERAGRSLAELVTVMDRLLSADGCPWDRAQTLQTLRPYLIEEAYEVLDAIDRGDSREHCEELGDLLLQIVFQAALRQRAGEFSVTEVAEAIRDKLVRRHPHVFGDAEAADPAAVTAQWNAIKAAERAGVPGSILDGVPAGMPALARAQRISQRAARVGFDWPDVAGCRAKVLEELEELARAVESGDRHEVHAELGDLLFAVTSLARKLDCDAELALRDATTSFSRRFAHVEARLAERDRRPDESNLAEMDALWDEAKQLERQEKLEHAGAGTSAPRVSDDSGEPRT
jgi:MazG family protein